MLATSERNITWLALAILAVAGCGAVAFAGDPRTLSLAAMTARVAVGAAILTVPTGTLLAMLLTRTELPGRTAILAAIGFQLFLPLYLQASGWDAGFGQQGWFSQWIGQTAEPWLRGPAAAIWIHALAATPWVTLIVGTALQQADLDLEELALLDGTPARVLLQVTLRQALPGVVTAALFVVVTTASEMTVTDLYRVRTYAEELYTNLALTADASSATIGIWPQIAMVGVLCLLAWRLTIGIATAGSASSQQPRILFPLHHWRWLWTLFAWGYVVLAIGVPLANLVYKAGFTVENHAGVFERSWTWARFFSSTLPRSLNPQQWECGEEYLTTLAIGATVASVSTILALLLVWLARKSTLASWPAIIAATLGLSLPGPFIGLGVSAMLNQPNSDLLAWFYDRTILAPVLAISVRTLPLAILAIWQALRSLGRDQIDSALAEGASHWAVLWRVAIWQRWPALAITWIGCFALAAGDLTASLLVTPPGMITVANHIFLLIHAGVHNKEAGLCLSQATLFAITTAAVLWLSRGDVRRQATRYSSKTAS